MALQQGVASASGVCKTYPSTSTSTTNRLVRRRGRGSLVRCRAFVWSREDLDRLNALSKLPRHQLSQDVVEQQIGDTCTFGKSFRNSIDSDHQPYIGIRRDAHLSQEGGGNIINNETIISNHSSSTTKIPLHYEHSQHNLAQSVGENISQSDHSDTLQDDLSNSKLRQVNLNKSCFESISQEDDTQNDDDDDDCNSYSSDFNDSKTQTQTVKGISATLIDLTL